MSAATLAQFLRRFRTGPTLALLAAIFLETYSVWPPSASATSVTIALRYDDYASDSPLAFEKHLVEKIGNLGGRLTIGVIPFSSHTNATGVQRSPLSDDHRQALLDWISRGVVDVSLHGYLHQRTSADRSAGEFGGLPRQEQADRVRAGRASLERQLGTPIDSFIPPWNACDETTVRVLEGLGFASLSAGGSAPFELGGRLRYLPFSTSPDGLAMAMARVGQPGLSHALIVLLIHSYDFKELDPRRGVTTLDKFIDTLRHLASADNVRLVSLHDVLRTEPDLGGLRRWLNNRMALVPHWIFDARRLDLRSVDALRFLGRAAAYYAGLFCGIIGLVSLQAGRGLMVSRIIAWRTTRIAAILLLVAFSCWLSFRSELGFRSASVWVVLAGLAVGLSCAKRPLSKSTLVSAE